MNEVEPKPTARQRIENVIVVFLLGVLTALMVVAMVYAPKNQYGISLFFGIPIAIALCAAAWASYRYRSFSRRSLGILLLYQLGAHVVAAFLLLVSQFEGVICLLMAAPLVLGASLACWLLVAGCTYLQGGRRVPPGMAILGLLSVFFLSGVEPLVRSEPPQHDVSSEVVVNAPPDKVWKNVVTFSDIPPPDDWFFLAGIAYPVRAHIEGTGPGAIRHCEFNTGPFVEPIEIWDEPRLLQFTVTENPPPMTELNPFGPTHPPHLHGYFESERGQFELIPLDGGKTLLRGKTWYRNNLYPASYWRLWSDYLIHKIHLRVLEHIKASCERA